jgi:hypothetical protein
MILPLPTATQGRGLRTERGEQAHSGKDHQRDQGRNLFHVFVSNLLRELTFHEQEYWS